MTGAGTWVQLIREAAARLGMAGVPDPGRDARLLARWASGRDAAGLVARSGAAAPAHAARFAAAVDRRAARVPLAQIVGQRLFWGRPFRVTADVLDPRPETETLIATALERPFARVLDLGTGTGCLLLTLLAERPEATGVGTDASPAALAVAAENAAALGLATRARLVHADWLEDPAALVPPFDLVVSNPPYLAEAELADLAPELSHEPRMALTPGGEGPSDGLAAYRAIAAGLGQGLAPRLVAPRLVAPRLLAPRVLAPGGRVLLEIGPTQAAPVTEILSAEGLAPGRLIPDFDGRPRVIEALAP